MSNAIENRTSFGLDAAKYRRYRPRYPSELFRFLAQACDHRTRALDCATGNGQAAISLAEHFDEVMAFDTSATQIAEALAHDRVEYFVAEAERLPSDIEPFDLVTIAQAAHWFDLPRFYAALKPLLKPRAVVAIWGYAHCKITPEIDMAMLGTVLQPLTEYWADGNRIITEKYATIDFPFTTLDTPKFTMVEQWDRDALFGYVRTWSAHKRFLAEGRSDPLEYFGAVLDRNDLWAADEQLDVAFDIYLRVGRSA